jgi:hypothetical protein
MVTRDGEIYEAAGNIPRRSDDLLVLLPRERKY